MDSITESHRGHSLKPSEEPGDAQKDTAGLQTLSQPLY